MAELSGTRIMFMMTMNGKELERDMLSPQATKEMIIGAITGLVPDTKEAAKQINECFAAVMEGQPVAIENKPTGISMHFQIPSLKKEKESQKRLH